MAAAERYWYNMVVMQPEATSLVPAARAGSLPAFEGLFRAHQQRVYGLALHLLGDPSAAEDVTQEAFLKAWEHLPRLRNDRAFYGWLRRITLNLVTDRLRSAPAEEPLDDETALRVADPAAPPERAMEQAGAARRVREAVLALPEHQRLVVAMYYWEEMPVEEIARALGIARGTVLSRLARGRETLKRRLGPHLQEVVVS